MFRSLGPLSRASNLSDHFAKRPLERDMGLILGCSKSLLFGSMVLFRFDSHTYGVIPCRLGNAQRVIHQFRDFRRACPGR